MRNKRNCRTRTHMTLVGQMPKKLFTGPGSLLSGLMRFFFFFLAVIHLSVNRRRSSVLVRSLQGVLVQMPSYNTKAGSENLLTVRS